MTAERIALAAAAGALLIWIYLVFARSFFWLARERDDRGQTELGPRPPRVCAVVPARNEADVVARSIGSLLSQDYPGDFDVLLVDDQSEDATASAARAAAEALGGPRRLEVLAGAPPPKGWTGKMWALAQGVERASALDPPPERLLFTDADIAHAPDNLRRLVGRAEAGGQVLTSLMAKLHCATLAERTLIPAFVFFFDMLYPFAEVNDPARPRAAAAGGCMLVDRRALERAGGIAAIRAAIIDDCALAKLLKPHGPIWLGLTERAASLRPYLSFGEVARMVSRSAYAQLGYSPPILAGVLFGLLATYLCPPLLTLLGPPPARLMAGLAWLLMAASFQPMLAFYRRSPLWGALLPGIGLLYAGFTVKSALDVWRGRGGLWKGRAQARLERG